MNILKDNIKNNELIKNGFIKLKVFEEEEIDYLRSIYSIELSDYRPFKNIFSTNSITNKEKVRNISDKINSVVRSKLSSIFSNEMKLWMSAFMIKPPGENTEFKPHQDWTFVDENTYHSGNIWIPLSEMTEKNGTLFVIPKSYYKYIKSVRSHNIPEFFRGNEELIKDLFIPINTKVGEIIIFFHSLIHYTPCNTTKNDRVVAMTAFSNNVAPIKFLYSEENEDLVEEYIMPDNYVFKYTDFSELLNKPISGKYIRSYKYKHERITEKDVRDYILKKTQ